MSELYVMSGDYSTVCEVSVKKTEEKPQPLEPMLFLPPRLDN